MGGLGLPRLDACLEVKLKRPAGGRALRISKFLDGWGNQGEVVDIYSPTLAGRTSTRFADNVFVTTSS
jgi:hypothetical protein